MVVKDTVNPTDCVLTNWKHTSLPQVLSRERNAMQAAEMVQIILAAVAVIRRAIFHVS